MKSLIFVILIAMGLISRAQQPVQAFEVTRKTDSLDARGFSLLIEGTTKKNIEKAWKAYLQRESGRAVKGSEKPSYQIFSNEYVATNYFIPSITNSPITIIANIYDSREGVRLTVFFKADGKSFNAETNPELLGAGQSFVERFGHEQAIKLQGRAVKSEQHKLRSLRQELSKLRRQQQSLEKGISRTQSDRLRTEKELLLHRAAQDTAVKQIARTQFTLNNLSPASADYQGIRARLKEHEKALRKASTDVKKAQKNIVKADQQVRRSERKIADLRLKQTEMEKRTKLQEEKLSQETSRLQEMKKK